MNIVMIPTYVTPDKHNIKAISFITLTKATYTVLRMEKSMPDLLLLCYDWFCLEGEKNKKKIVTLQMLLSIQEISAWF